MIDLIKDALDKEQIKLPQEKIEKLDKFAKKLMWWNSVHNITGAKSKEEIVENIIDSLYPITFIKEPNSLLDVGTGAGFPGLILAIAWENSLVTLAEPINKRAAFLKYISIELGLKNVTVFKNRVEKLQGQKFSLITSRAVTDTDLLLKLTKNVTKDDTEYLFFKGSNIFNELKELDKKVTYDIVTRKKRNYLWIKSYGS